MTPEIKRGMGIESKVETAQETTDDLHIVRRSGDWALVKTEAPKGYRLYHAPKGQRAASIPNHKADPQTPPERGAVRLSHRRGLQALVSIATAFPTLSADDHGQLRALLAFCDSEAHRNALT